METRGRSGTLGTGSALLAAALAAPLAGQAAERVSVSSAGTQGNNMSLRSGLSADGRFVAFESDSSNLVPGDTNGWADVFVRDRQGGTTERVSVDSLEVQGNSVSNANGTPPALSADGRYVLFTSGASNLVAGDTNNLQDVFVRDRLAGTTERVSLDSLEVQGNATSIHCAISGDGRYVAFHSFATNLAPGDANGFGDVFVRDRQNGTTALVSLGTTGFSGDGPSFRGSFSSDGRYLAFASLAADLVVGDSNGKMDVFVRDLLNGTTERVSLDSLGGEANQDCDEPALSADGRFVAFSSRASLAPGDTGPEDVFVHDRQNHTTERVSIGPFAPWTADSFSPTISSDGRLVAFVSATPFLVGDTGNNFDVYVRDRQNGTTECVSLDMAGAFSGMGSSDPSSFSADGRYVAFASGSSLVVPGDTNGAADIFVRDRQCTTATSAAFPGDGVNEDVIFPENMAVGASWHALLFLGHDHGASGPLTLKVRTTAVNGPTFVSPLGGRPIEFLVTGPLLATLVGAHDGFTGDIGPVAIPADPALVGLPWAAQYTVLGGGFADLSQAVSGVLGCL